MTIDISAIRQRAEAATPGPWQWFGNTDVNDIYLATVRWGRQIVMMFERWGMQSAQPTFIEGRTWKANPGDSLDFDLGCGAKKAKDLAVFEVAPKATRRDDPKVYRADVSGLRSPDATFIAHSRQDVADLLAEVDRLTSELKEARQLLCCCDKAAA